MTIIDRWKNWKPKSQGLTGPAESGPPAVPPGPQKFGDSPGSEPSKPTKPPSGSSGGGFVGFVGSTSAKSQKIEAAPTEPEWAAANAVLGRAGVRLMTLPEGVCVGIWSDTDGPEVRAALRIFGSDTLPIRYLDSDVPMRFKLRRVPGEPVPASVLAAMEQCPTEPWVIRDKMLAEMGWGPQPWAEGKAAALNRLFLEQGVTGKRGRIKAATVRHGEQAALLTEESEVPDGE